MELLYFVIIFTLVSLGLIGYAKWLDKTWYVPKWNRYEGCKIFTLKDLEETRAKLNDSNSKF